MAYILNHAELCLIDHNLKAIKDKLEVKHPDVEVVFDTVNQIYKAYHCFSDYEWNREPILVITRMADLQRLDD